MKYGYFDDINREYVITDPATPLPGSTILAAAIFSVLFPTPAAATLSIKMQSFSV